MMRAAFEPLPVVDKVNPCSVTRGSLQPSLVKPPNRLTAEVAYNRVSPQANML